jgi:hypothetical protein
MCGAYVDAGGDVTRRGLPAGKLHVDAYVDAYVD